MTDQEIARNVVGRITGKVFSLTIAKTYQRQGEGKSGWFRTMTLEEIKAKRPGDCVWFLDNQGMARMLRINGKIQTWKTRPGDVSVPVKYGLKDTGRWETEEALERMLVKVG